MRLAWARPRPWSWGLVLGIRGGGGAAGGEEAEAGIGREEEEPSDDDDGAEPGARARRTGGLASRASALGWGWGCRAVGRFSSTCRFSLAQRNNVTVLSALWSLDLILCESVSVKFHFTL